MTGDIPAARDGHSSCVIEDCMYIFGGYEETNYRFGLDVYRYLQYMYILHNQNHFHVIFLHKLVNIFLFLFLD